MESRVLLLNNDPVFEDRLLSLFDGLDTVEVHVVRSVSEQVMALLAEHFDGVIVEGPAASALEAATITRQHFPSLKILCAPWAKAEKGMLEEARQQEIVVLEATQTKRRFRRAVLNFVASLEQRRREAVEGIDPCHSLIGNLNQFSAAEILQMACLSQRSGRFTFKSGRGKSEIYLHHGNIRHGLYGTLQGEEAVAEIFRWRQGRFYFEEGIISQAQTVDRPWAHLLIDNLQKLDETMDVAARLATY